MAERGRAREQPGFDLYASPMGPDVFLKSTSGSGPAAPASNPGSDPPGQPSVLPGDFRKVDVQPQKARVHDLGYVQGPRGGSYEW